MHGSLHILHGVNQQVTFPASEHINCDPDLEHEVDEEELESEVGHALHRYRTSPAWIFWLDSSP